MASTYSTNLAIELIGTGDQAGAWGNTTNTNLGTLIEQAISGYVTQAVATGTDTTITIPDGATGVARNMYIELTGTGGASTNLIVPANKKLYFIFNNTSSGQVTVKVSGQTGVSVPNKAKMVLVSNGTDIVDATNYVGNLSAASANITVLTSASATITNLINTSASITTITNSPTFSAGTANGVLYLNASKVATSGSALTFDGTTLGVTSGGSTPALRVFGASTSQGQVQFGSVNGYLIQGGADYLGLNFNTNNATRYYISDTGVSVWSVGGSEQMRLTSTGLGIGTSSPGEKLNVVGGNNTTSTVNFTGGSNNDNATIASDYSLVFQVDANNTVGGRVFNWRYGGNGYEGGTSLMTLNASGNLGLGVTPSAWAAHTVFDIGARGSIFSLTASGAFGFMQNAYWNGSAYIYKQTAAAAYYSQTSGIHYWFTAPSGTAGNSATFTERMTLDSSGNLGLGVTPSAWDSSLIKAIQIGNNGASISSFTTSNTTDKYYFITNNGYYDGVSWKYVSTKPCSQYLQLNGEHRWYNAPSGTAGNAITFTQAMTLDASGFLSIGKTSNQSKVLELYQASNAGLRIQNSTTGTNAGDGFLLEAGGSDVIYVNYESGYRLGIRPAPNAPASRRGVNFCFPALPQALEVIGCKLKILGHLQMARTWKTRQETTVVF